MLIDNVYVAKLNFNMIHKLKKQSGQALLIVLLLMAVVLTVVLSTASRSVTDVAVTGLEEDALRAFSAAEAGIEQSLLDQVVGNFGPTPADPQNTNVTYTRTVTAPAVTTGEFEYPKELVSGETATFWLTSHATNGSLTCTSPSQCFVASTSPTVSQLQFCWGKAGQDSAIEVMFYYDDSNPVLSVASPNNFSNLKVARVAFDANAGSHANNFTSSGVSSSSTCDINGKTFVYQSPDAVPASVITACAGRPGCLVMAKVRIYYNSVASPVGMIATAGNTLPAQGIQVESTGVSGDATRKVNVFQSFAELPDIFDAAIFSFRNLSK